MCIFLLRKNLPIDLSWISFCCIFFLCDAQKENTTKTFLNSLNSLKANSEASNAVKRISEDAVFVDKSIFLVCPT